MWRVALAAGCLLMMCACVPSSPPPIPQAELDKNRRDFEALAAQRAAQRPAAERTAQRPRDPTNKVDVAWIGCVDSAARKFARSAEAANIVVAASLSACSTEELAMQEAWTQSTNAIAAANVVRDMRRAMAGQLLTEIVGMRSHPATTTTSPAKAKEVAI
jgi:hypothetical protein